MARNDAVSGDGPPTSAGTDYRHSIDIRFCLPPWLGGRYLDLRIGRDRRHEQRPHVVPPRVRWCNRAVVSLALQMAAAWLAVAGVAFYWITQSACGANVSSGPADAGATDEVRFVRGTPEGYVSLSEGGELRMEAAEALVRTLAAPPIVEKLAEVSRYYADTLQIAIDNGRPYDACALPLGKRIVFTRSFIEASDAPTVSALYAHELQHMRQALDFIGTPEGEDEAREIEKAYRQRYREFAGTEAYARWAQEHATALAGDEDASARTVGTRIPDIGEFSCGSG